MALATNPVDINRSTQGLTLPTDLSEEIFAAAVEESAIMRLARNIEIPGSGLSIPVVTGDPVADFVTETAEKPVSNSTFSTKVMTPYKVAVIETFSNQFRRDLPSLYDELVRRLPYALGKKIDATVLGGTAWHWLRYADWFHGNRSWQHRRVRSAGCRHGCCHRQWW